MDDAREKDDGARIDAIAGEIAAERRRQVTRWGRQDHPSIGPAGSEPFGRIADRWKAINDARMETGAHSWDAILLEEVFEALAESDPARRRAELVQLAAVAAAEIEAIDRFGVLRRGPLISPRELAGNLDRFTVIDVRYLMGGPLGGEQHAAGHVAGAAYVDMDRDLADPPGAGGRHPLPEETRFEEAMRRAGVRADRPVVAYDDWQGRGAARAWWLLRFHGHPDVRVLDGGWSAWLADGLPVESGAVHAEPGDFTVSPDKGMPVVEADDVLGVEVLVDARAAERFSGATEPVDPVAGRIPGAVNVPTTANLDEYGRFLPAHRLREAYARVGADASDSVAAYCGSGVTATHDLLAMEVAGIRGALYPGSWSGWITDPDRPIETG
ncbi:sulfurtransferase [Nocardioides zhouii]|uniref:sulfurtransferase n=1 Tax=Nocardioides zhouii TaxID=1168729 RepID=UPI0026AF206F